MKLRNKLILSCAALAAVATTAVSTTYAWYTSNVDVSASGITAKSTSAADSTLLISKTGAQRSWGASVDLEMTVTDTGSLVPVEYDGGSYYAWDMQNDQHATSAIDTTLSGGIYNNKILSFMLYFKSGTSDSLAVGWDGITITNTTGATLPSKTVLTNTGMAGVSTAAYTCDIMRALRLSTNAGASVEVESGYANQAASPTRTTYQLETNYHATADSLDNATSFNAHEYYDAVKGTTIATETKAVAGSSETGTTQLPAVTAGKFASKINLGSTGAGAQAQAATPAADNVLAVRFDVYLDGWDTACFDACQGQTFTIALSFSVIA